MGLIGGFLTPILVGDPDAGALPLLALYRLARRRLVRRSPGGAAGAGSRRAAVLLSFAWTGYLLTGPPADALAAGIFIVLLALSARRSARRRAPIQPLAIGLFELALLVARFDLGGEAWLLFGLLAAASLALAARRPSIDPAPPLALGARAGAAPVQGVARNARSSRPGRGSASPCSSAGQASR